MPDLTSRKSETDADRRRNEQQFAALKKGLANAENMGEREREIFDRVATEHPATKKENQRHRAASDIFDQPFVTIDTNEPLPPTYEAIREVGRRMGRYREEFILRELFGHDPPKPPADKVIDAGWRIIPAPEPLDKHGLCLEYLPPRQLPDQNPRMDGSA